jgi:hypothetical protein
MSVALNEETAHSIGPDVLELLMQKNYIRCTVRITISASSSRNFHVQRSFNKLDLRLTRMRLKPVLNMRRL